MSDLTEGLPPEVRQRLREIITPAHLATRCSRGQWKPARHLMYLNEKFMEAVLAPHQSFLNVQASVRHGKALDVDTPIPTPDGWTAMGKLQAGDTVFDERGQPCRVVEAFEPYWTDDAIEVSFGDGTSIVADAPHRWTTYTYREAQALGQWRRANGMPNRAWDDDWATSNAHQPARRPKVRTTEELEARTERHYIPVAGPLDLPDVDLPVDPYILGYWLGDGDSRSAAITCGAQDAEHLLERIAAAGYRVQRNVETGVGARSIGLSCAPTKWSRDSLQNRLRSLGVLCNKHVPEMYLRASAKQRLELLRGLMDSDGGVERSLRNTGRVSFTNQNRRLADAAAELLVSLGSKVTRDERPATLNGQQTGAIAYRVSSSPTVQPFSLPRKASQWADISKGSLTRRTRAIEATSRVGARRVRCIAVDSPSHLYLAGDGMVPTHNSELLSVWAVVWFLGVTEGKNVAIVTGNKDLAETFSTRAREIFREWGPAMFGKSVVEGRSAKDEWYTSSGGCCFAVSVGGRMAGRGFDFIIVDDPIASIEDARSETKKQKMTEWYSADVRTRLMPGGLLLLTMARWTDDDMSAVIVEKAAATPGSDPWVVVKMPAIAEAPRGADPATWRDELGRRDGEALWPEKWPVELLTSLRVGLPDPRAWDALYQQNPVPRAGNLFDWSSWKFVNRLSGQIVRTIRAWDLAGTRNAGDFTVGAKLAAYQSGHHTKAVVLDVLRGRWKPDEVERQVRGAADADGPDVHVWMETPKGDPGVTALHYGRILHDRVFEPNKVKGGKEERADIYASVQRRGMIEILGGEMDPWVIDWCKEHERFPNGANDDQVDAGALAYNGLYKIGETEIIVPDAAAMVALTRPDPTMLIERLMQADEAGMLGVAEHAARAAGWG